MQVVRYAKLSMPIDVRAVQAELLNAGDKWQPHLNTYHYTGSWNVLPLRSPGGSHTNVVPDLMGQSEYADTIYMEQFPVVSRFVSSIQCPVMSVRFLNLQAGAIIKQHQDLQLSLEQGEARLHFPVITNPLVEFYCEDERIVLNEGECWYLNANLNHRVSNNSDSDRIHLVVDCKVNDWITNLIYTSPQVSFKKEAVDDNLLNLIKHLRLQNTETSNKLADELDEKAVRLMAENAGG